MTGGRAVLTACSVGPPYHRNASDAAACRAYATAVVQDTPLANIDAISAGAYATSQDLGNLITTAFQRYGSQVAPVDWCNAHGYPEHPLGLGA
jgi:hypothetical protein